MGRLVERRPFFFGSSTKFDEFAKEVNFDAQATVLTNSAACGDELGATPEAGVRHRR